jgi:hypothetical protein
MNQGTGHKSVTVGDNQYTRYINDTNHCIKDHKLSTISKHKGSYAVSRIHIFIAQDAVRAIENVQRSHQATL